MPDLLLELFSEEIPARMQAQAMKDLQKLVTNGLVEAGSHLCRCRGILDPAAFVSECLGPAGAIARSA